MSKSYYKFTPLLVGSIAVIIIVIGIVIDNSFSPKLSSQQNINQFTGQANKTNNGGNTDSSSGIASTPSINSPDTSANTNTATLETLTAKANYNVPEGGINSITVTITLNGENITDINVEHSIAERESQKYINSFDSKIKTSVVGKNLSSLSPARIGGASLTSAGFYQALSQL